MFWSSCFHIIHNFVPVFSLYLLLSLKENHEKKSEEENVPCTEMYTRQHRNQNDAGKAWHEPRVVHATLPVVLPESPCTPRTS